MTGMILLPLVVLIACYRQVIAVYPDGGTPAPWRGSAWAPAPLPWTVELSWVRWR
ncbi:hypothetical protein [Amycolatopsis thermoflava]|uniref:hypothetical protein n=1 Tax=Amycolatopsis thermoflava TaxID=84480 RepID=UPI00381E0FFB